MIPGYLGSNIEGAPHPDAKGRVNGNWDKLPKVIRGMGSSAEEIFAGYYDVQKKVGKDEMKNIPYGAIAVWTLADKLGAGLQQLLAGVRKFTLDGLTRDDIFSANRETERETNVPFVTDIQDAEALEILDA